MRKQFSGLIMILIFAAATLAAVKPGIQVCADWGGAKYLATVTAVSGDKIDVLYADGDKATLSPSQVREIPWDPQLAPGSRVLACWNNSAKLYAGTVMEVAQLSYKVKWDDGSAPSWVPATKILKL